MRRPLILVTIAALCAVTAGWFLLGTGADADAPVVIAVEADYEPFAWVENGELTGFDVDVSRAICSELERPCEIRPMSFQELLPGLKTGDVSIVVAGLGSSPERQADYAFSDVYYRSRSFFITRVAEFTRITPAMAPELVIGAQKGSLQFDEMTRSYAPKGAKVLAYETYDDMSDAILEGEVNALFVDGLPGYDILRSPEGRSLMIGGWCDDLPPELTEARIAVARRNAKQLLGPINEAILELKESGAYEKLARKYFSFLSY
ncbi:ABC transporter substrate-binding protein [Sutterella sp.]|uniref:substrate-binding periplasmic protein n=1 Tax=Sutterella sp. TaxID=1981025 RepID=UPI0026DF0C3E|nr:transporter substrate-binding domain-containing protein [Sutterella sp.]MDO5531229.1 transporter substrate-binding domain-containing protein [Sutterella sp.]